MLRRRYRLHARARLAEAGGERWLVCDHPLQWLRVNESAWALLRALDGEAWLDELAELVTPALADYLDSLAEAGALLAEYAATPAREEPDALPRVHAIVPARGQPDALSRCLESLRALDYPPAKLSVTVVDDGSPRPLQSLVRAPEALWVRLGRNAGPATARNAGAEALKGASGADLIAFIDSDCVAEPGWLLEAVAVLEGAPVAALGGGVAGLRRDTPLARYEDVCSSLHMGARAGRAGLPGMPVPYLPSCNLVVRLSAFRAVGGFREGWRTGEDVDLSWRLAAAGERLFYWPALRVQHDHRVAPSAFFGRRRDYARSEAHLRRAHPARFARAAASEAFLLAYAVGAAALHAPSPLGVLLGAVALALLAVPDAARIASSWRRWPAPLPKPSPRTWAAAGARMGAARIVLESRLAVRQWLVLLLPAAFIVPGSAPLLLLVLLCGGWGEWRARAAHRADTLSWPEFAVGWLWDSLAYSLGRGEGIVRGALRWKRRP